MEDEREAWLFRLIEAYEKPLLHLCFMQLRDRQLAEDAVQETYLKAFRHYDPMRLPENEKSWLMKIALNTCRDVRRSGWFRHNNRRVTPDMLPEAAAEFTLRDESLTLAVMALPPKLREAVLLRCIEGLPQTEIADILHISPAAVSSRLNRARQKLRAALKGGETDG